jgi:RHH-type transcriptional regulator, rel operon repressor / antitoxin RelB
MRQLKISLPRDLDERLQRVAARAEKSDTDVAVDAIDAITAFLDLEEWQTKEIEAALKEADAGDFLTDEELAAAYRRWTS